MPGAINGEGGTFPVLWGWGSASLLGSSVSPAGTSLWEVSVVCLHGLGESTLLLSGKVSSWTSPVLLSVETGRVSHCLLALTPAQQASLHQLQAKVGVRLWQPQDRGPSPQLACSLLPSPFLASLLPAWSLQPTS